MLPLDWLMNWYLSQCNGDWEHEFGVKISTLDNPGWSLDVDLVWTDLEGRAFKTIEVERTEHDWYHCRTENGKFMAYCGPLNFAEVIEIFKTWAEASDHPAKRDRPGP